MEWERAKRVGILVIIAAAGCTRAQITRAPDNDPIQVTPPTTSVTRTPPEVTASATPTATPPPTPPPETEHGTAWTDPAIVDALAKDCHFHPVEAGGQGEMAGPLACAGGLYSQSCVVDPCFEEDQAKCEPRCEKTCDTCSLACTQQCVDCKKSCHEPSCEHACAAKCGDCHQACIAAKDRCSTGECVQEAKACNARLLAQWKRSGCAAACPKYNKCREACPDDNEKCPDRCAATLRRVCPPALANMCMFNGMGPGDEPPP